MSDRDRVRYVYVGFPQDGRLRWLRWLDDINPAASVGSPVIKAYLVLLPEGTDPKRLPSLAEVTASSGLVSRHDVVVGSLPDLRLGMVFLDGEPVGDLPMVRSGSLSCGRSEEATLVASNSVLPGTGSSGGEWPVIPATGYRLGQAQSGFCLLLFRDGLECIVPASEVFRVFCAPESMLANLILSDHWDAVRGKLLNEAHCDRLPGEWRVGLRKGLTGGSALALAAYLWTEAGVASRNLLRRAFPLRDFRLHATIPFAFDGIRLAGEGIYLNPRSGVRRFLMLRIATAEFSEVREMNLPVHFRLDNNNVRRASDEAEDAAPSFMQVVPVLVEGSTSQPVEMQSDDPPSSAAANTRIPYEAAAISGLPDVVQLPLEPPRSSEAERRRRIVIPEPTYIGSTAMRQRGHRGIGAVAHHPEARPSFGFGAVTDLLDGLLRDGLITAWMPTIPLDGPFRKVSGVEAWELPAQVDAKRMSFSFLRDKIRRTCLVAEIEIQGRKLYWLELERRSVAGSSSRGFCYLLLSIQPELMDHVVSTLLAAVARSRGLWDQTHVDGIPLICKAVRHVPGGGGEPGVLRPSSVLREIRVMLDRVK